MKFSDKDLEGAVLSAALFRDTKKCLNKLQAQFFHCPISHWVYEYLLNNPSLTFQELVNKRRIDVGDVGDLLEFITEASVSSYQFDSMVKDLKDLFYKRNLHEISKNIKNSLDGYESRLIIQSTEKRLAEIQQSTSMDDGSMNTAHRQWIKEKENMDYIKTGISELDGIVRGLKGGRVWVVGGESGVGKSFWALQLFLFGVFMEKNCLFFSTELTRAENFERLLSMQKFFFQSVDVPSEELANHPNMRLYDDHLSVDDIVFESKRQNRLKKVDLVVVDHIQDIEVTGTQSQVEALTKASGDFKRLAIENDIGVILVSQLNKEGKFFGASKLNQIAHCSIKLEREDEGDLVVLSVEKNRSGRRGRVFLNFKIPECVFLTYAGGYNED